MTLETIVSIFGKSLNKNLVVRRRIDPNPTFKVYKTLTFELFEIVNKKPSLITSFLTSSKITESQMEQYIEKAERDFLQRVFSTYGNKQVSNPNN